MLSNDAQIFFNLAYYAYLENWNLNRIVFNNPQPLYRINVNVKLRLVCYILY
jgi:hypothetical protein